MEVTTDGADVARQPTDTQYWFITFFQGDRGTAEWPQLSRGRQQRHKQDLNILAGSGSTQLASLCRNSERNTEKRRWKSPPVAPRSSAASAPSARRDPAPLGVEDGSDYNKVLVCWLFLCRGKQKWSLCFTPLLITNARWCKRRLRHRPCSIRFPKRGDGLMLWKPVTCEEKWPQNNKSNMWGSWSAFAGWLCTRPSGRSWLWLIACHGNSCTEIQNSLSVTVRCVVIWVMSWLFFLPDLKH